MANSVTKRGTDLKRVKASRQEVLVRMVCISAGRSHNIFTDRYLFEDQLMTYSAPIFDILELIFTPGLANAKHTKRGEGCVDR